MRAAGPAPAGLVPCLCTDSFVMRGLCVTPRIAAGSMEARPLCSVTREGRRNRGALVSMQGCAPNVTELMSMNLDRRADGSVYSVARSARGCRDSAMPVDLRLRAEQRASRMSCDLTRSRPQIAQSLRSQKKFGQVKVAGRLWTFFHERTNRRTQPHHSNWIGRRPLLTTR